MTKQKKELRLSIQERQFLTDTLNLANLILKLRSASLDISWQDTVDQIDVDRLLGEAEALTRRSHMEFGVAVGVIVSDQLPIAARA